MLKSGARLEGQVEEKGNEILVVTSRGKMTVPRDQVASIRRKVVAPPPPTPPTPEEEAKAACLRWHAAFAAGDWDTMTGLQDAESLARMRETEDWKDVLGRLRQAIPVEVAVVSSRMVGGKAQIVLKALRLDPERASEIQVTLILEAGAWKVSQVGMSLDVSLEP